MKVFILGGTGFIGYHATLALLRRGHSVLTLALPPAPPEAMFPAGVTVQLGDFNTLTDEALLALLSDCEGAVFAAGADDRVTPKAPAYPFFHQANVETARRFFRLAKAAGVRRGVLLSSYFAHFDRIWPALHLADRHPYIRSRQAQEAAVLEFADETFDVTILELPYIFGWMPGRKPLWQPLVKYLHWPLPWVFYPRGGSAMVGVAQVAEAITGAVERGVRTARHLIGDENLTWQAFLQRLATTAGLKKTVVTLPDWLVRLGLHGLALWHRLQGRESGLDPVAFFELQTRETFFDPLPAQQALGFDGGGLEQAFRETLLGCGYRLKSVD